MDEQKIIELYFARDEEAIKATAEKYGKYCRYIAFNILRSEADTEEALSDAYLKTWNSIPPNRPKSLKAYIGSVCRNAAFDIFRKNKKDIKNREGFIILEELAECIPSENKVDIGDNLALREALNAFLRGLKKETRIIFMKRYWYGRTVSEISEETGLSVNGLNVILFRTRKELKEFLGKEGFFI